MQVINKVATGPDKIPPKLVKIAPNIIDCHICNILNQSISSLTIAEQVKIANVRLVYKKHKREEFKKYQPVSDLSSFSKIYENFFQKSITPLIGKFLYEFVST